MEISQQQAEGSGWERCPERDVLRSVSKTSNIFTWLLFSSCAIIMTVCVISHTRTKNPGGHVGAGRRHQTAWSPSPPLPRPAHTHLSDRQRWTRHESPKQMLTRVQRDGEESLTARQTCVHCATTTLGRLKHQRSRERTPAMSGFVCARVRSFAVSPPKNTLTLERERGGGGDCTCLRA